MLPGKACAVLVLLLPALFNVRADDFSDCPQGLGFIGTGYCSQSLNNEKCGFDGGDCCECDCLALSTRPHLCGIGLGYDCLDPSSTCFGATPAAPAVDTVSADDDAGRFWDAYASDRYSLLMRGVRAGEGADEAENGGAQHHGSREKPTKYLVFATFEVGLGNHLSAMMSAFALSIAFERVFLHDWILPAKQCGATYADLFVPPFSPWSVATPVGTQVTSGRLPVEQQEGGEEAKAAAGGQGPGFSIQGIWAGLPNVTESERERCSLDLTQNGVHSREFDRMFIENRGEDPRPDCPVLFLTSNQNFVEVVASASYGNSTVGDAPLSDWLQAGNITTTLFAGLFRPVASVRKLVADATAQLFPSTGQNPNRMLDALPHVNETPKTMAAHVRSYMLRNIEDGLEMFAECLLRLATSNNISTVVVATDMPNFGEYTRDLDTNGVRVVSMEGVERLGEDSRMRNTLKKSLDALVELLLIGHADIAVTSPLSSFSALSAAAGGRMTQRVGGLTCKAVVNEPEFHMLDCGITSVDITKWQPVYPFITSSNIERCNG